MLKKVNTQKTETLSARLLSLEYLEHHYRAEWDFLVSHCLEPNIFYTPDFLMALRDHIIPSQNIKIITTWRQEQHLAPELTGLFPFLEQKFLWGQPVKMLQSLIHPYIAEATPLLHKKHGEQAIINLLDFLEEHSKSYKAVNLAFLPQETAFYDLLTKELSFRDRQVIGLEQYQRAALASEKQADLYLADMRKSRRKDIAKRSKKLAATGKVKHIHLTEPHDLSHGLQSFLDLEASGWKGKQGSALKCSPKTAAFAQAAFCKVGNGIKSRFDFLTLDAKIIAGSLTLIQNSKAWTYKSAYDENFAQYAPSLQADIALTKILLKDQTIALADSAALPGHVMEGYWQQRITISNLLFATSHDMSPLYLKWLAKCYHFFTKTRNDVKSIVNNSKAQLKTLRQK